MMNANTTDAILQKIKIRCQNPIRVYSPSSAIDLAIAYTDDGRLSIRRADRPTSSENSLAPPIQLLDCDKIGATSREGE